MWIGGSGSPDARGVKAEGVLLPKQSNRTGNYRRPRLGRGR